jgi:predicted transport protein
MTDLEAAIDEVVARINKHEKGSFNEENTAVVLIEPILAALGLDLTDLASVDRQFRVYDGTRLDYALKINAKASLFVEVKGLAQSLDDPKFVAQTVNYANNEGVLWCVLTNGVVYRVYKTNEPVTMTEKLMFEVDLRNIQDEPSRSATLASLMLISRSSLIEGRLDATAELVFTGGAVRAALESLLAKPTGAFRASIEKAVGLPIDKDRLDRVFAHFTVLQKAIAQSPTKLAPVPAVGPANKDGGSGYSRSHHVTGKPKTIVELFDQLDDRVQSVGDVVVTFTKTYVNFSTPKKSFMTAELFRDKLKLYFSIPWAEAPKPRREAMRDVTSIGHFGMGDTEFVLSSQDQLDDVQILAALSHERNKAK